MLFCLKYWGLDGATLSLIQGWDWWMGISKVSNGSRSDDQMFQELPHNGNNMEQWQLALKLCQDFKKQ